MINPESIQNKLFTTQQALNDAKNMLIKAQRSAMINAESLLASYEGDKKEMLVSELATLKKAMKNADSKTIESINKRMLELIKKCQ